VSNKFYLTPNAALGIVIVLAGVYLRRLCFKTLADNFTFEFAIREKHKLVTHGPYAIVRHPAYSALAIVYIGFGLWHGSEGSWVRESGVLHTWLGVATLGSYGIFMIGILLSLMRRGSGEDEELKRAFGKQWEEWSKNVPYRILPGIF
jgi:protein-S-isoprenylcysteine O-methyltransferase Ste14